MFVLNLDGSNFKKYSAVSDGQPKQIICSDLTVVFLL